MKYWLAILLFILLSCKWSSAQPESWTKIANPYDSLFHMGLGYSLHYSQNLDAVVLNGQVLIGELVEDTGFVASEYNTFPIYDGENWSYLSSCEHVEQWPFCFTITDYKNGFVTCKPACSAELDSFQGPSYYDGSDWHSLGEADGSIIKLKTIEDTLYMTGFFTYVGEDYAPYVAKYTGDSWIPAFPELPDFDTSGGHTFRDLIKYQGEWYLGGNIDTEDGRGLFVFRDGEWQTLVGEDGEGLSLTSTVQCLEVFQGELYVGGLINGDLGTGIQKWDGTNWSEVGGSVQGGLYPTVYEMLTIGDHLYCRGNFYFVNGTYMRYLARWDGTQWCGLQLDSVEWMVTTITQWDDRLVGSVQFNPGEESSHFYIHDGETFGPCTSTVSIPQSEAGYGESEYDIHPNPCTDHFYLNLPSENSQLQEIAIYSLAGQQVAHHQLSGKQRNTIDVSGLESGMYIVRFLEKGTPVSSTKLVVQRD